MKEAWTVERIKKELPGVEVLHAGVVYKGQVAGRKMPFATVFWGDNSRAEWAWETICRALNGGSVLNSGE